MRVIGAEERHSNKFITSSYCSSFFFRATTIAAKKHTYTFVTERKVLANKMKRQYILWRLYNYDKKRYKKEQINNKISCKEYYVLLDPVNQALDFFLKNVVLLELVLCPHKHLNISHVPDMFYGIKTWVHQWSIHSKYLIAFK